jgi:two-component system OmpR family sensor kinase
MWINRHSIMVKINITFIVVALLVSLIFAFFFGGTFKREHQTVLHHFKEVHKLWRNDRRFATNTLTPTTLKALGFERVDKLPPHTKAHRHPLPPHLKRSKIRYFVIHGEHYISLRKTHFHFLGDNRMQTVRLWIVIGYGGVTLILTFLYLIIRKNLQGLKPLHEGILAYEKGEIDPRLKKEGFDEISKLSTQFYHTIKKLDTISGIRQLFLRNMMHELKTPLTKAKFYLQMHELGKLEVALGRIEQIINEMGEVERLSTTHLTIGTNQYRTIDLIDTAKDMLFLEPEQLTYEKVNGTLQGDFKLLSLVIKNLVDNAIKYSPDHHAYLEGDDHILIICSKGEPLAYPLDHYIEPFFKGETKENNLKGFGLGLYIVHEICKFHQMTLSYHHSEGKNCFTVQKI